MSSAKLGTLRALAPVVHFAWHEWFVMREMRNLNGLVDFQSQLSRSRTTPPS
jgi:hypothetical protein